MADISLLTSQKVFGWLYKYRVSQKRDQDQFLKPRSLIVEENDQAYERNEVAINLRA